MRFRFDETKTTQAAAHLLELANGRMSYMVLIKLLYLADREMLVQHGKPITGDLLVSMKNGPVLSNVLNLINSGPDAEVPSAWFDHIDAPRNYDVELKKSAGTESLSRAELAILKGVHAKYGHMNKWDLVKLLHEILPEWDAEVGSSSSDIDPSEILHAAKWDNERIREAELRASEALLISSLG